MFKPTYLYIKTHNDTGLKYFGKTITKDPSKYKGSGTRWLNHINYHGNNVTTEILGYYTDKDECVATALDFSAKNNIVESADWANLEPEDGLQGGYGGPGDKNSQFGKMWITNGTENVKTNKSDAIPHGWYKGRTMPAGWGDNVRDKLAGRTHIEMLGEEKANILKEQKHQRMLGNNIANAKRFQHSS
jgi:hypothetical protein